MGRQSYQSLSFSSAPKSKVRGFTLMELVITVGVIALLVAAGMPAFYAYSKHNAPKTSAQDIKNVLLEAQSLARSPAAVNSGSDFYYVTINYDQTAGNRKNGRIEIGRGTFNESGGVMTKTPLRPAYHIDSDAWITQVTPDEPEQPTEKDIIYYYLIPQGQILFNRKEPAPGFGYSPRCQYENNASSCYYQFATKSYIQIRTKDVADSTDPQDGDQTVVIDGNGGNVNILDGLYQ